MNFLRPQEDGLEPAGGGGAGVPEWRGGPGGPKCGHADATEDKANNADNEKVDMLVRSQES